MSEAAVCCFKTSEVEGEVLFLQQKEGVLVKSDFQKLPSGKHGYHIHQAGDLRGDGCKLACAHWHKGSPTDHGGAPNTRGPRHTGDLGNIESSKKVYRHFLKGVHVQELWGRSLIIHEDEDDLGKGSHEDSKTTGHSGKRIACAIIGRVLEGCQGKTRKTKHK